MPVWVFLVAAVAAVAITYLVERCTWENWEYAFEVSYFAVFGISFLYLILPDRQHVLLSSLITVLGAVVGFFFYALLGKGDYQSAWIRSMGSAFGVFMACAAVLIFVH